MFKSIHFAPSAGRIEEFSSLIMDLSNMIAAEGLQVAARRDDILHFLRLDAVAQTRTLLTLRRYLDVCQEVRAAGHSLRNDTQMLWRMFRYLNLRPPSDLLSQIESDDLIEIYDDSNLQVFRNLFFYSVCSYSIDEILCRPWFELFRREGMVTEALQNIIADVLTPPGRTIVNDMPPHILQEDGGARRHRARISCRIFAPLWGAQNQPCAIVVVTKVLSYESTVPDV